MIIGLVMNVEATSDTLVIQPSSPEPEQIYVSKYENIPEMQDIIDYQHTLGFITKTIGFTSDGDGLLIMIKY